MLEEQMLSKLSAGASPALLDMWSDGERKGQASHLTERRSGPKIKSESLQGGERKLENAKCINY